MASVCEICGRSEEREQQNEEVMIEVLHVCEQCRGDRQFGATVSSAFQE